MDKESEVYQFPEMNLIAGSGAEKIIQKIYDSSLRAKLLLKNDKFLNREWYQEHLVNYLEFFVSEEEFAETAEELEGLFFIEGAEWEQEEPQNDIEQMEKEPQNAPQQELQVVLYQKLSEKWQWGSKNPRIRLKILEWPFQIPFELELIPYAGTAVQITEKTLEDSASQEKIIYHMFSQEEYLSRSFYKIVEELELITPMSWYKDGYDILTTQMISGRKVSESFRQLFLENAIPGLKERLEIVDSFQDYKYMEKRWENYMGRFWTKSLPLCDGDEIEPESGEPNWQQVIQLFVRFFTPIFDVALKNELFIGDWMPQIGRYLD
ncbi:MAG: hypothetical protein HFH50_13425 [Lachnospiraceae bacterium]|jgi:hypothetical protein|nr:hypothetical protein [Lachnospiraceae bacterium]